MLEELAEEYKRKPYKEFGSELFYLFGETINQVDNWTVLPFEKQERFVDFVRGLQEQKVISEISKLNNTDINNDYDGFVEYNSNIFNPRIHNKNELILIEPWVCYLNKGKAKYIQSEQMINGKIISKSSMFIKQGTVLAVLSFFSQNENPEYENRIVSIIRSGQRRLSEEYKLEILQGRDHAEGFIPFVKFMVNRIEDIKNRETSYRVKHPFIELQFRDNKYHEILEYLNTSNDAFKSMQAFVSYFGDEMVSFKSRILPTYYDGETPLYPELTLNQAIKQTKLIL